MLCTGVHGRLFDKLCNSAVFGFAESQGNCLGIAGFFHGNTVQIIRCLHGGTVVGDDQELRITREVPDHPGEPDGIRLIERGIGLIKYA
jgi:hypothetical protein